MSNGPRVRFSHGAGTAIAIGNGVALVDADATSPTVTVIENSLAASQSLEQLMTALSSLGFTNLPAFAIVIAEGDSVTVLHRGSIKVDVISVDGAAVTFFQPSITTWREEFVESVIEVRVETPGVVPGTPFWFGGGLVPASRLVWPLAAALLTGRPSAATIGESTPLSSAKRELAPAASDAVPECPPVAESVSPMGPMTPVVVPIAGEADDLDFANLVHQTMFRNVEDAAVRPLEHSDGHPPADDVPSPLPSFRSGDGASETLAAERTSAPDKAMISGVPSSATVPAAVDEVAPDDPDHDGHTVARPRKQPVSHPPTAMPIHSSAMVQAVSCSQAHPNPANAQSCRLCGSPITNRSPHTVNRPQLGVLRFSTNQAAPIRGPILIGRAPPNDQELDGEFATTVEIDNSEVSKLHAAIHVSEWYVHVADQGSTNGTAVIPPGKPRQTLRPFEKMQIAPNTVVDLGGAVTFRYDTV